MGTPAAAGQPQKIKRILVLHAAALGDFVITWPLLINLKIVFAPSRLELICHDSHGRLAVAVGLAERYRCIDEARYAALFADDYRQWDSHLRGQFSSADSVIDLLGTAGRSAVESFCRDNAKDYIRPGDRTDSPLPRCVGLLESLQAWGIDPAAAVQRFLRWRAERVDSELHVPSTTVLIHPGSGSAAKCWPLGNFIDLAEQLTQHHHRRAMFVLGHVELQRWPSQRIRQLEQHAPVLRGPDILTLTSALQQADSYIGNDSGVTHLSAAVGCTTVAIFGPSEPQIWRPLGRAVRVLAPPHPDEKFTGIDVHRVLNAWANLQNA